MTRAALTLTLAAGLAIAASGTAGADDVAKKVQQTFRGQILVSTGDLPANHDDAKSTIQAFKKARVDALQSTDEDGVAAWTFHYTAFLNKKPMVRALSIDFYTDDREKRYVANEGLLGIDPHLTILTGKVAITEDDGLVKGKRYLVKLVGEVRGREVTFATTKLTMK